MICDDVCVFWIVVLLSLLIRDKGCCRVYRSLRIDRVQSPEHLHLNESIALQQNLQAYREEIPESALF